MIFLLQTLQFRLVVKELTKGLCWLSGQFQALIEFNSVTEAEIAKLVQRMLLLWLPCLTHYEDKCMTVQVLHCNSISFHFPQTLDGQNIYNSCCTLHLEYSKLTTLTVKFNNDKSKWVYILYVTGYCLANKKSNNKRLFTSKFCCFFFMEVNSNLKILDFSGIRIHGLCIYSITIHFNFLQSCPFYDNIFLL